MMRRVSVLCFSLLVWLAISVPASAHHSMAMYDQQRNITITGIVARIQFQNTFTSPYLKVCRPYRQWATFQPRRP